MEEEGMTDLQFKDFLRGLIINLEDAKNASSVDEKDQRIEKLINRFQTCLETS